jgi:outer membrane protein OmpA-like peptidoglycan-associated protein
MTTTFIAMIALGTPAWAQEAMTEAEMAEKFAKQKTRGLSIATPGVASAQNDGEATGVQTTADAATMLPKDEQVNINVSFDFDSAALRADQKPKLNQLCNALKAADVQMVRILGHTDASGSADYNERLSKLRAEEVKRFLETDCGFPADRMEALGVGERFPYDPTDPAADVNRRVEFQALG